MGLERSGGDKRGQGGNGNERKRRMCWEMMAGIGFEWHLPRRGTTKEYGLFCVAVALEACAALCSELREWFMKMTVMPKLEYAYEEDALVLSNQILHLS